jgi:hypothetical protein
MSERIALHSLAWELTSFPAGEGQAAGAAQNGGQGWVSVEFPLTVRHAHLAAGNELPEDWREREWWYRCRFAKPGGKDRVVRLLVGGLDYHATVYVNGDPVGEKKGAYGPLHMDVSGHLADGENVLAVRMHPLVENEDRSLNPSRNPLRWKNAGLPAFDDVGMWDDVWAAVSGPVYFDGWFAHGEAAGEHGDLTVRVEINNTRQVTQGEVRLRVEGDKLPPVEQVFPVELATGLSQQELSITVPGAQSWFPHTAGKPVMYRVKAELALGGGVVDHFEQAVAFRNVRVNRSGDAAELWRVTVNGKKVPLRGVSWSALPLPAGQKYETYIDALADAGVNAVRVWGGRHREAFYDACDQKGVLVLHEFPFGLMDGRTYPRETPDFPQAKEIVLTARGDNNAFVRRLRNHPSIFLWVGGTRIHNIDNGHVMRTIEEALRLEDGTRSYVPVFPLPGVRLDNDVLTNGLSPEHLEDGANLLVAAGLPAWSGEAPEAVPGRWKKYGGRAAQTRAVAWAAGAQRAAGLGAFVAEVRDWAPEGGFGLFDFAGQAQPGLAALQGLYAPVAAGLSFDWRAYTGGSFEAECWGVRDDQGNQVAARVWVTDAAGKPVGEASVKGDLKDGLADLGAVKFDLQGAGPFTAFIQAEGGKPVPYPLAAGKPPSSYTLAELAGVRARLMNHAGGFKPIRDLGSYALVPFEYLVRGVLAVRVAVGL